MQFEWTMKEAYGVLFINILINNVDANGWNFTCNGRNIRTNDTGKIYQWSEQTGNSTIRIGPELRGGGLTDIITPIEFHFISIYI
jgi:hypothetical protein